MILSIDFPDKYVKLWDEKKNNSEFSLSPVNQFICTNFDLYDKETPTVSLIIYLFNKT